MYCAYVVQKRLNANILSAIYSLLTVLDVAKTITTIKVNMSENRKFYLTTQGTYSCLLSTKYILLTNEKFGVELGSLTTSFLLILLSFLLNNCVHATCKCLF